MERTAERKAELRKADGEAIERAIATGADPFDLVMAATGEGAHICVATSSSILSYRANRCRCRAD